MPDFSFFQNVGPFSLKQLSEIASAELHEDVDGDTLVEDVAPVGTAQTAHITFLDNPKYKKDFLKTKAGACIVHQDMKGGDHPEGVALLYSDNPYMSYAKVAAAFYPETRPDPYISDDASIDSSASIGKDCIVEAGAVIQSGAKIADRCWIGPNATIGRSVQIGEETKIDANVSITHALIGQNVRLHMGVRIGQDGFGFASGPTGHVSVPQLGRVVIEDNVDIGANTTIDRGAGPDTVIGRGSRIDNLVQIAHNVKIGQYCVLVAQSGVSGSTEIGDFSVIAGQVGIAGHLKIGKGVRVAAKSGIMRDLPDGAEVMGYPAVPIKQFMRQITALARFVRSTKKGKE